MICYWLIKESLRLRVCARVIFLSMISSISGIQWLQLLTRPFLWTEHIAESFRPDHYFQLQPSDPAQGLFFRRLFGFFPRDHAALELL